MTEVLSKLQKLISEQLDQLDLPEKPSGLYEPIRYILTLGGKRLRPVLTLLACDLYSSAENAMHQALAVEVFHNFTLMHDDIMDDAPLRRGQQTVHEKWNLNTGILSGDAAFVKSYQLLAKCKNEHLPHLLNLFNKTAMEVCEGQQHDVDFESRNDVAEQEYIHMIQLKTSVLLGCALQMGAIVGEACEDDQHHLYQFGLLLGTAFQIKDDLLDCFGEAEKVGKQVGGDIIANKKTLLLIHAKNTATGKTLVNLKYWLDQTAFNPTEKVEAVKQIYRELNIEAFAQERMDEYYQSAMNHLERVSAPDKGALRLFAEWLFNRDK